MKVVSTMSRNNQFLLFSLLLMELGGKKAQKSVGGYGSWRCVSTFPPQFISESFVGKGKWRFLQLLLEISSFQSRFFPLTTIVEVRN